MKGKAEDKKGLVHEARINASTQNFILRVEEPDFSAATLHRERQVKKPQIGPIIRHKGRFTHLTHLKRLKKKCSQDYGSIRKGGQKSALGRMQR